MFNTANNTFLLIPNDLHYSSRQIQAFRLGFHNMAIIIILFIIGNFAIIAECGIERGKHYFYE